MDDRPSVTQTNAGPLPESARISLNRSWGCIARFLSHFEVIQEGEQATFHCHSQSTVPHLWPFHHPLPLDQFRDLWRAVQESDPGHWAAEYGLAGGPSSTGPLLGTLSILYTLDGQTASHTVNFQETEFDGDARMQKLYAYLVEFETAHLQLEAGKGEEAS
jgi:hypothetical protein